MDARRSLAADWTPESAEPAAAGPRKLASVRARERERERALSLAGGPIPVLRTSPLPNVNARTLHTYNIKACVGERASVFFVDVDVLADFG